MTEIHTFINCKKIKSFNLRPETHHLTVRINNNNNYAPVCKEVCKLTNFSMLSHYMTKERTTRKVNDPKGELINSLSGSDCIGLTYGAVT